MSVVLALVRLKGKNCGFAPAALKREMVPALVRLKGKRAERTVVVYYR